MINNNYNDWHPVIHTLIAFKLPLAITNGWVGSIALFQIVIMSLAIAYSIDAILVYTNERYAICSFAFMVLNPQFANIVMYPWKDVAFAIGALLLVTFSLKLFFSKGEWIRKARNLILFVIVTAITTFIRHNAVLFTVPLIFANLFYISRRRASAIIASIIVLCLIIKLPLYSFLNVEKPNMRKVETLGLPMTVIGAAVTYNPNSLDDEIKEFAYKVAPKEVWEEKFTYGSYNSVKWDPRTNNNIIEEYGYRRILSLMIRCFREAGRESTISVIRLTAAPYTLINRYYAVHTPVINDNSIGLHQNEGGLLRVILEIYCAVASNVFPHLFMFLGSMHLILIASILAKCKTMRFSEWKKALYILPVFAYNYGTTLLLTGVEDSARFFYYTFLIMPVLLVFLFANNDEGEKTDLS